MRDLAGLSVRVFGLAPNGRIMVVRDLVEVPQSSVLSGSYRTGLRSGFRVLVMVMGWRLLSAAVVVGVSFSRLIG